MICREIINSVELGKYKNMDIAVFQSPAWLQNVKEDGSEVITLEFLSESKSVGFIAGLKIQSKYPFLKKITKNLYFFSGPVLAEKQDHLRELCLISLREYAKKNGYFGICIDSYDYPYDIDYSDLGYNRVDRSEYIIDLTPPEDEILRRFKKQQRTRLRRLEGEELELSIATDKEAVDHLLECLGGTKERRNGNALGNYSFYYMTYLNENKIRKLVNHGICKIFYIKSGDSIISSTLCMIFNNRAYAILNGTKTEGYNLGVPVYIHWTIIQYLKRIEVTSLNLGGLPKDGSGANLAVFKESLGARLYPCSGGSVNISPSLALNILAKGYGFVRSLLPAS